MITTLENWTAFYALVFPDAGDSPPKRWEASVASFLFHRGYIVECVREAIDFATRYGTVECCPILAYDDVDRRIVESYLPDTNDWARPEYQGIYTIDVLI